MSATAGMNLKLHVWRQKNTNTPGQMVAYDAKNVKVTGTNGELNQQLENAGRTADFLEFAELLAKDALHREESCGGHFRAEHQTEDGEAQRDDEHFSYVAAWEFTGTGAPPVLTDT